MIIQVGKFFRLDEFTVSQAAARNGIPNIPTPEVEMKIRAQVQFILDPLREALGYPVVVSSGYRAPKVNKLVGGSRTSQHMTGEATDLIVPGVAVLDVVKLIRDLKLPFDQLIDEFGEWTHVSYKPNGRREVLKARTTKKGTIYERIMG